MKKIILAAIAAIAISGCSDADIASHNLSKAADNFDINRRIVFYNGITGGYMLSIEGFCSLGNQDPSNQITVVCKVDDGSYKKHFLGLSDNVTYFVEQIDAAKVGKTRYRVVFKPEAIIPDVVMK